MVKLLFERYRTAIIFFHDILLVPIAWLIAYLFRYNISIIPFEQFYFAIKIFPLIFFSQVFFYLYFGLYRGIWKFASIADLIRIIKAVVFSCFLITIILFLCGILINLPRSILPVYALILIFFLGGNRLIYRFYKERHKILTTQKKVLVVGAGDAGDSIIRDLLRNKSYYQPIIIVDDRKDRVGKELHGVPVVGKCSAISNLVAKYNIELIIIAIPSATSTQMLKIVEYCRSAKIPFQTVPGINAIADGKISVLQLREVAIEDLLGRDQINLNWQELTSHIENKTVLVTGGGGSIGSELCVQVAKLKPKNLIILEHSEFNLYEFQKRAAHEIPEIKISTFLGDIKNKNLVADILKKFTPNIIFHAAAYKHVPILENQIYTAVENNIFGTKVVAELALQYNVEKFIFISTDKAVKPANVMGATKRSAEILCQSLNEQSKTKFIVVRFGNVLGSSGSVVPLFKEQLMRGGPITVTHPEVTRFFMTIPEACQLILQASSQGDGGEIFVLDMGEPIKIRNLAEQMITLSGKETDKDIKIIYTGLRPGEKLHEELFYQDEILLPTKHTKIMQTKTQEIPNNITEVFLDMQHALQTQETSYLLNALQTLCLINK